MIINARALRNVAFLIFVGSGILASSIPTAAYPECDNVARFPLWYGYGERCGPASGVTEAEMCTQIYNTEVWSTCNGSASYFSCYIGEPGDYWWWHIVC